MTRTTENPRVAAIHASIESSYRELNELIETQLSHLNPELLYREPAPQEWTLMQSLAHIAEFMPYWGHEVAQLVAQPGRNFGRTQQHEGRLGAINQHAHDTLNQMRTELPKSYQQLIQVIDSLRDGDLELTGHHVKFGPQTLGWFIREFITDHLTAHLTQMRAALSQLYTQS